MLSSTISVCYVKNGTRPTAREGHAKPVKIPEIWGYLTMSTFWVLPIRIGRCFVRICHARGASQRGSKVASDAIKSRPGIRTSDSDVFVAINKARKDDISVRFHLPGGTVVRQIDAGLVKRASKKSEEVIRSVLHARDKVI